MRANSILELAGPLDDVTSVYMGLDARTIRARWRIAAATLARQGAPPGTLAALEHLMAGYRGGSRRLVAFATGEKVLWHRTFPLPMVAEDRAAYGRPPLLAPLLDWSSRHPPHVVVALDRHGGDVTIVKAGAQRGTTTSVTGPDDEITRGGPRRGDHPRIERRAVGSWRHNAAAVAAATAAALKQAEASLLLVAGQPRIVALMLKQMPHDGQVTVHHLPGGGRAADGSDLARRHAVQQAVAAFAAQKPDPATGGWVWTVADTLDALACGRVRALVVADDPADERVAWFAPQVLCADRPGPGLTPGRLVDVAVRAALLTDADVHIARAQEAGPDGIAALCRFG